MFKRHFIDELSAYLDDQLSKKERQRLEKHLASCKHCRQELERLSNLSTQLKLWNAPGLDSSFDSSVKEKIVRWELEGGQIKMKRRNWAIVVPSGILAGILVFMFLSVALKQGFQGRLRQSADEIGEKYSPGYTATKQDLSQAYSKIDNYEPHYLTSPRTRDTVANARTREVQSTGVARIEVAKRAQEEEYFYDNKPGQESKGYDEYSLARGGEGPVESAGQGTVIVIQPVIPATGQGDMIIRTGVIKLEVEDGKETYSAASKICQELGGYLASSRFYKDREGNQAGTITMRIPKDKFTAALDRLGALGKVENISTDSQDVSREYANLKSQLDAAMVVYKKVLDALEKRQNTIPEAIRLESELTPILRRVENLKDQIEYLNNAVSFTTVTVDFHESVFSVKALRDSKRFIQESAITAGIKTIKFLAGALPIAILGAVLVIIAAVVIMIIKLWVLRLFKRE